MSADFIAPLGSLCIGMYQPMRAREKFTSDCERIPCERDTAVRRMATPYHTLD